MTEAPAELSFVAPRVVAPRVTVLVPVCNVESYLDECLASLVAQDLEDFEALLINDGSTDGSRRIIGRYLDEDGRFGVIDKPNTGYGDSMNAGLARARGTYVAILESDDEMAPGALSHMLERAQADDLEVLKCSFWLSWSGLDGSIDPSRDEYFPVATPELEALGPHAPRDVVEAFSVKASIWSALYRRSFLERNRIRFLPTPGASYQDASFTFKVLACATRFAYDPTAVVRYRQDNAGSSVNSPGKVYCICDEHAEMRRFLDEDRPDLLAPLDPVRAHVKYANYRWNYERLAAPLRAEFLERFSSEMREELERGSVSLSLPGLFSAEELEELDSIVNEPGLFAVRVECEGSTGKLDTLARYWRAGGIHYVLSVLGSKLGRGGHHAS